MVKAVTRDLPAAWSTTKDVFCEFEPEVDIILRGRQED